VSAAGGAVRSGVILPPTASSAASSRRIPAAGRPVPQRPRFPGLLQEVWNLPARLARFTGREAELGRGSWMKTPSPSAGASWVPIIPTH